MKSSLRIVSFCFILCCTLSHLKAQTVYIAETGKKYHSKKCPELQKSKKELDLKQALKDGYTACTACGADKIKLKENPKKAKKKEEEK